MSFGGSGRWGLLGAEGVRMSRVSRCSAPRANGFRLFRPPGCSGFHVVQLHVPMVAGCSGLQGAPGFRLFRSQGCLGFHVVWGFLGAAVANVRQTNFGRTPNPKP